MEARLADRRTQLSDSKLPDDRPILTIDDATYTGFLTAIKTGHLAPSR